MLRTIDPEILNLEALMQFTRNTQFPIGNKNVYISRELIESVSIRFTVIQAVRD